MRKPANKHLYFIIHIFIIFNLTLVASEGLILFAQSVYVPIGHESYDFLKRMEARELLTDYKDAAKPLSRMQVASALVSLEKHIDEMTTMERETYEFLKTEFNYEFLKISGDPEPTETRWHIYSHEITQGLFNLDINYNVARSFIEGGVTKYVSQGVKLQGYAYNNLGLYFNFVDNRESGDNVNLSRLNSRDLPGIGGLSRADLEYYNRIKSPQRGVIPSKISGPRDFQYDELNAQFSWMIGPVTLSLEKMNNVWGYGRNGPVILSDNVPSYPQIKLRVPLSKDIDFVYFHGELNSTIIDSSLSYSVPFPASPSGNPGNKNFREVDIQKYIAAHLLEISLWHGIDFSIGESIIYSDRGPLLMYMIPIVFFKAGEHYNDDKDNCQIFGSLDLNVIRNVNFYLSLFIDELSTDQLLDPNLSRRQVAFTSGTQLFDIPLKNFDLTAEYTRVNPAAYDHKYPATTFTNNGFILGNWMGQNADDVFFELGYIPIRALRVTVFSDVFRKGGILPLADQYAADEGNWTFLFGPLHVERSVGLTVKYQPLRDVFVNFSARLHKIEDEADPEQNRSHQLEFTLGARLGIW